MHRLSSIAQEIVGLFVDDAGFALAIFGWLLLFALVVSFTAVVPPAWAGLLLFAGLACVLVVSCLQAAGRR